MHKHVVWEGVGMKEKDTVLITGASSGIGAALAYQFAETGQYDLILVARRKDRLKEMSHSFMKHFGVESKIFSHDLAAAGAAKAIHATLQSQNTQVDVLVNNAGMGQTGPFSGCNIAHCTAMLNLNIIALTELTRLVLPGMLDRNHGKIFNVASTVSFHSCPMTAVYAATKAYVLSFTEAIATELSGTGVTVSALCPGATTTEFPYIAGGKKPPESRELDLGRGKKPFSISGLMDAESVARTGYKGLINNKTMVIPGIRNRLYTIAVSTIPRFVLRRILAFKMMPKK